MGISAPNAICTLLNDPQAYPRNHPEPGNVLQQHFGGIQAAVEGESLKCAAVSTPFQLALVPKSSFKDS